MHQGLATTAQRVRRLLEQRIRPAVVGPTVAFAVEATDARFEPCTADVARSLTYRPFDVGNPWGPPWHTVWFRMRGTVPADWRGYQVVAHLDIGFFGFGDGFQAEGLVYRDDRLVHAVQPDRRLVIMETAARGGEEIELYVEAAANPVLADDVSNLAYAPTLMGDPATTPNRPIYRLRRAELGILQPEVASLALDVHLALDLLLDLAVDDPLRPKVAVALEAMVAALDLDDVAGSAAAARAALGPIFDVPSAPGAHRLVAVGHAHLDTAWLWPLRETHRKVVRTFANAVDLLDRYPDHRFAHSQAVHYAWVADRHPDLFERVKAHVAAGRWEPVGGMWVEADLNLSGGESLVRQLLHGQRAFEAWFGHRCRGGFLPDDFGYPAALPQILDRAGCRSFFTQKLSWSETNRFPHHTFWWEGLDGSRVLTHFSPVDTYNAVLTPGELRFAARNFADHAGSSASLVCFGHGDGGGGPTSTMVERAQRLADVQGLPLLEFGSVEAFFDETEAEYGAVAPTWVGEMYLEKHRGTFTSQLGTKQGNVRNERLLREAELWSVGAGTWPGEELDHLWKELLVQQFHDILPGSSIAWVHRDAEEIHASITDRCHVLLADALGGSESCLANPAPWPVSGVVVVDAPGTSDGGAPPRDVGQTLADGSVALAVELPALASVPLDDAIRPVGRPVMTNRSEQGIVVDNGLVRLTWDPQGRLSNYVELATGRPVWTPGDQHCGLLVRPDAPAAYDAWDIDEPDSRHPGVRLDHPIEVEVVDDGPLVVTVRVRHAYRRSTFTHDVTVTAGSARVDHLLVADWHEDERRVSFVLPTDVHAREATCGVQFGHVRRPRHHNTSWDAARFESCAHRYVHAGEHDFGVALLFAGPRGVDVRGDVLSISLLRSPRYPDPGADRGEQRVTWSTWTHRGEPFGAGLEAEAQRVSQPVRPAGRAVAPVVTHDLSGVVVEAVKRAEDASGDLVVRLWESHGGRASGRLALGGAPIVAAHTCNLLEDVEAPLEVAGGQVRLELRPFQLVTLRLRTTV